MSRKIREEQGAAALVRTWLTALEKTMRDFHGPKPKMVCRRAYEHAAAEFIRVMTDDYGLTIESAESGRKPETIRQAVGSYIDLGGRAGLFKDESDIDILENNVNSVEITVRNCPYTDSCKDLIADGIEPKDLTCARMGCFRGAALALANLNCSYDVLSVDFVNGCHGVLERM